MLQFLITIALLKCCHCHIKLLLYTQHTHSLSHTHARTHTVQIHLLQLVPTFLFIKLTLNVTTYCFYNNATCLQSWLFRKPIFLQPQWCIGEIKCLLVYLFRTVIRKPFVIDMNYSSRVEYSCKAQISENILAACRTMMRTMVCHYIQLFFPLDTKLHCIVSNSIVLWVYSYLHCTSPA